MKRYRRNFEDENIECSRDSLAFEILSNKFPHVGKAEIRDILAGCGYNEGLAEESLTQVYGSKRQKVDHFFEDFPRNKSRSNKSTWETDPEINTNIRKKAVATFGEVLPLASDLIDQLREQ